MNILGISCFYHDSAACLIADGKIVAAVSEERFNRRKNSPDFPINAVNYCLQSRDLTILDVDYIAFYEKPFLKFHRTVLSHLQAYPFSFKNFMDTMPHWLQDRLIMPLYFGKELGFKGKSIFIKHHLSHAASTFLVSPFEEAAILTADGVGEWATMTYGNGDRNKIQIKRELHYPNSLGLFYSAITTYLGFKALEGEGKVMGLAGYGKARYLDKFKELIKVWPDGSFLINNRFFGFNKGSQMYNRNFIRAFGEPRKPESKLDQRHCDIAATLQKTIEDILIKIANNIFSQTKTENLCLAGGLFLNCVANSRILENTPFKEVFIQPATGDSGGALGAALYAYHCLLGNDRKFVMQDAYLGPDFSSAQIRKVLMEKEVQFRELGDSELLPYIARCISEDKIIGWFQGRMEFGPRALGNRSILANPCNPNMKDLLNDRVKHRESFRPYAPVVLKDRAREFFDGKQYSPFMLLAPSVKINKAKIIPAVIHVDKTARVQIVSRDINSRLYQLIKEFEAITDVPMLINTSFNLRGEPIVCSPEDAISCFNRTDMDCLVLDNYVVEKKKA